MPTLQNISLCTVKHDGDSRMRYDCDSKIYSIIITLLFLLTANKC